MSPARRHAAVAFLRRRHGVSERRACRLVGQHRSTQRYEAVPSDFETLLIKAMRAHSEAHPTWGYRRIHALLVSDGWDVNVKRIHRLWLLEDLKLPTKKASGQKAFGSDANAAWNRPAVHIGHVWSYDFVSVRTVDGGPLRVLNVVDEHTREALAAHVARNIGARDVVKVLATLFASHGAPKIIRSDNGREFIADIVKEFLAEHDVAHAPIAKGRPQQNCYVESFNASMRRELLNGELLHSVREARVVIGRWIEEYNNDRPHRGLGMRTPAAVAREARKELANNTGRAASESQ